MKRSMALTGLILAVGLNVGGAAPAQRPEAELHPGRLLEGIELTEAQLDGVRAWHQARRAARQEQREQRRAEREAIRAELAKDRPDAAKLHALVDAQQDRARAAAHDRIDAWLELHGMLTPEQRAQLAENLAEREKARPRRRWRGAP